MNDIGVRIGSSSGPPATIEIVDKDGNKLYGRLFLDQSKKHLPSEKLFNIPVNGVPYTYAMRLAGNRKQRRAEMSDFRRKVK